MLPFAHTLLGGAMLLPVSLWLLFASLSLSWISQNLFQIFPSFMLYFILRGVFQVYLYHPRLLLWRVHPLIPLMVTMLSVFFILRLGLPYFSFLLLFPAAVFIYLFSLPFLSFLFTFSFLLFLSSSILLLFVFLLAHVYVIIIFLKYVNFYLSPTVPYSAMSFRSLFIDRLQK